MIKIGDKSKLNFTFNNIDINRMFKVDYNITYYGELRIPGLIVIQNECRGEKEIEMKIKGEDILNETTCNNYKETINTYNNIPYFYNQSTKACESRKLYQAKLNEYCVNENPDAEKIKMEAQK